MDFWLKSIHEFCSYRYSADSKNPEMEHSNETGNIDSRTTGPPVILVGTFADQLPKVIF